MWLRDRRKNHNRNLGGNTIRAVRSQILGGLYIRNDGSSGGVDNFRKQKIRGIYAYLHGDGYGLFSANNDHKNMVDFYITESGKYKDRAKWAGYFGIRPINFKAKDVISDAVNNIPQEQRDKLYDEAVKHNLK
jgi:hypothetical protein